MMIGNIVFGVVPGGFIVGVIGGSVGATVGSVFRQAIAIQNLSSDLEVPSIS